MAKFNSTTFGTISGRHGSAVAATTKDGQSILRVYRAPANPKTEKQMIQRTKFGFVNKELSNYQTLFKSTFKNSNGRSQAVALALANAVIGDYPNFAIDYSKLQIAAGRLDITAQISIAKTTGSNVKIDWDNTVDGSDSSNEDNVNFVFINTNSNVAILRENQTIRSASSATLELPAVWAGIELHCWIFFTAPDGSVSSNSQYISLLSF
ncbi:MAG: DUF6266 family protein [Bacteroidales bacterium]